MIINRVWAMPNKWTFKVKPIRELVDRYVGNGKGWLDPFAGMCSPAETTNDLNPESPSLFHMDAFDFVDCLDGVYDGCIFDPPYSLSAVSMFYKNIGLNSKLGSIDPTASFKIVKDKIAKLIKVDGIVIYCGWNSNAFGKKRGFQIIEVLLVAHGGGHNDTIVTVERKIQSELG